MNRDRFVLIITISILSNLLHNAPSVKAKTLRVNLVVEQTTAPVDSTEIAKNLIPIARVDPSLDSDRTDEQDNLKNFNTPEALVTSKPLGLVGIAIASFISLILLKFLFIPPAEISPTPISSAVKTKAKAVEDRDRQPTAISPAPVRSDDRQPYVAEKKLVENFETTSQLTILNSNTPKIDVVVELIKYLQQPDDDLRRKAISTLARIGDSRGIKPLTEILSQVNSSDRSLAVEAITQITRRSFQPIEELLFSTFDDENPEIKQNAIRDLAVVYAFVAQITKQLARMQVDRDMQVRQTAKKCDRTVKFVLFSLSI